MICYNGLESLHYQNVVTYYLYIKNILKSICESTHYVC